MHRTRRTGLRNRRCAVSTISDDSPLTSASSNNTASSAGSRPHNNVSISWSEPDNSFDRLRKGDVYQKVHVQGMPVNASSSFDSEHSHGIGLFDSPVAATSGNIRKSHVAGRTYTAVGHGRGRKSAAPAFMQPGVGWEKAQTVSSRRQTCATLTSAAPYTSSTPMMKRNQDKSKWPWGISPVPLNSTGQKLEVSSQQGSPELFSLPVECPTPIQPAGHSAESVKGASQHDNLSPIPSVQQNCELAITPIQAHDESSAIPDECSRHSLVTSADSNSLIPKTPTECAGQPKGITAKVSDQANKTPTTDSDQPGESSASDQLLETPSSDIVQPIGTLCSANDQSNKISDRNSNRRLRIVNDGSGQMIGTPVEGCDQLMRTPHENYNQSVGTSTVSRSRSHEVPVESFVESSIASTQQNGQNSAPQDPDAQLSVTQKQDKNQVSMALTEHSSRAILSQQGDDASVASFLQSYAAPANACNFQSPTVQLSCMEERLDSSILELQELCISPTDDAQRNNSDLEGSCADHRACNQRGATSSAGSDVGDQCNELETDLSSESSVTSKTSDQVQFADKFLTPCYVQLQRLCVASEDVSAVSSLSSEQCSIDSPVSNGVEPLLSDDTCERPASTVRLHPCRVVLQRIDMNERSETFTESPLCAAERQLSQAGCHLSKCPVPSGKHTELQQIGETLPVVQNGNVDDNLPVEFEGKSPIKWLTERSGSPAERDVNTECLNSPEDRDESSAFRALNVGVSSMLFALKAGKGWRRSLCHMTPARAAGSHVLRGRLSMASPPQMPANKRRSLRSHTRRSQQWFNQFRSVEEQSDLTAAEQNQSLSASAGGDNHLTAELRSLNSGSVFAEPELAHTKDLTTVMRRLSFQPGRQLASRHAGERNEFAVAGGRSENRRRSAWPLDLLPAGLTPARHRRRLSCMYISSDFEAENVATPADVTLNCEDPERKVLEVCGQADVQTFQQYSRRTRVTKKIGEGVYGEVFLCESKRPPSRSVIKIMPIEGDFTVNEAEQKRYGEVLSELLISKSLSELCQDGVSSTDGFVRLLSSHVVRGAYPALLRRMWDKFNSEKGSENEHPNMFAADQLFLILQYAHAGTDLESYELRDVSQAVAAFWQIAFSLAVAEDRLEFEHRDLHWGNVLLRPADEDQLAVTLCGRQYRVPSEQVAVTLIDFTLSRLRLASESSVVYNNLAEDPDLFTATGDPQFDVYRQMRDTTGDQWRQFHPQTNVQWLRYIVEKLTAGCQYAVSTTSREHRHQLRQLQQLRPLLASCDSARQLVTENCAHWLCA